MKKIIQSLSIILLLLLIGLIVIFIFNPANLRNKIVGDLLNNYLQSNMEDYQSPNNKSKINQEYNHPLLSQEQQKALYDMGIDVSQLPTELDAETEACFVEKLGEKRVEEIKSGRAPDPVDFFKTKDCF